MFRSFTFLIIALTTTVCHADTILYFNDGIAGTDRMAQALAAVSGQHTVTTATSVADFTTQIQTGNFTLGIFFQQNYGGGNAAFAALETHVANGGRAIATDWARDDSHVDGFGASFTGGANQTTLTITDPLLLAGLTNPITLSNPGWGTFSNGLNSGVDSSTAAMFGNAEGAIVIGNGGRSIVNGFLSDTFANGSQGIQIYINEINSVLANAEEVPEPATMLTWAMIAGTGLAVSRWKRRAKSVA